MGEGGSGHYVAGSETRENFPDGQGGLLLIACGGTGGHITPGIALAQRWRAGGRTPLLAISGKSVDGQFRSNYPALEFITLPGSGFSLKPISFCRALGGALRSLWTCLRLIRSRVVVGVVACGGFTSLGPCLAAFFLRRPIFLYEANQRLGKAIRFLAPLARKVYVPTALKDSLSLRSNRRFVAMAHPLRSDFVPCDREEARKRLSLPREGNLLLVMGGSQGAKAMVEWATCQKKHFATTGWHCTCLTGPGGWEKTVFQRGLAGKFYGLVYQPFCSSMHLLLSAVDLAICRAGAGTIAELVACATPAILIPYPYAAHDHQTINALALERCGAAIHWPQERLPELWERIGQFWQSGEREVLRRNLEKLRPTMANGAERLAAAVEENLYR